jgi:chemotaxis protein CheD
MDARSKRIHVIQGEFQVTDDDDVVLSTILGSCVAACLRDPIAGVGGMNHFLLPGDGARAGGGEVARYGVHLMELLINGLLKKGASRDRLEAKIIGGGKTIPGLSSVGEKNAIFAKTFLQDEGIKIVGTNVGGDHGRKLEYWPVSGRARQCILNGSEAEQAVARERKPIVKAAIVAPKDDIEFF